MTCISSNSENSLKSLKPVEFRRSYTYCDNLNKFAIFEHIMFFPHVYFENYFALTEKIYADCKRNYPSIELIDLVCPSIYIGLKKPIF